jgi:hypothetical protein
MPPQNRKSWVGTCRSRRELDYSGYSIKAVARPDLELPAGFDQRDNRCNPRTGSLPPQVDPVLPVGFARPKATISASEVTPGHHVALAIGAVVLGPGLFLIARTAGLR